MPIFNPVFILIVLPLAGACVWVLAAPPAYPHSRVAGVAWVLLLLATAGIHLASQLNPSPLAVWTPPVRAQVANGLLLLLPFAGSFSLWRLRRRAVPAPSTAATTLAIIALCLVVFAGIRVFNRTCVFHDYWHDDGEAWCPAGWQARL